MELKIKSMENAEKGSKKLPAQFSEEIRVDIIKRAVEAIQANKRQKYGINPEAGKRPSVNISKRRRDYRGCYGKGISRIPRKVMSRSGTQFNFEGAFAPGTVGGRVAHGPKSDKIWDKKINIKEKRKAIRSALAASINSGLVKKRGHEIPNDYPFLIETKFEDIDKTKSIHDLLNKLGFEKDLERGEIKKIRAGKGKARGRKYKKRTSILIVVSKDCNLSKSAKNIAGIDIVNVKNINAELLAPGCIPGRATIFTEGAIDILEKENLFM